MPCAACCYVATEDFTMCLCMCMHRQASPHYVYDGASVDAAGGKLDPTAVSVQSGKTYEQEFAPEIERAQVC